jgi:hypothetical protein
MSSDDTVRDERLGIALRSLPVPDHGPAFWDDLAGRLTDAATTPVTPLDQRRRDRRRRFVPLGAAAAVMAALLGTGLLLNDDNDAGRHVVADRPATTPAGPAMLTAAYAVRGAPEQSAEIRYRFAAADDGSFRWTVDGGPSEGGIRDLAYDAAGRRAVEITEFEPGRLAAYVTTEAPPGGPDLGFVVPDPLALADSVISLAKAGDRRVTPADHAVTGRPVWRYDGPLVEDRLGDGPDAMIAEVDQATGVVLDLQERAKGRIVRQLLALSAETSDQIDRSRFQIEIPKSAEISSFSRGFRPTTLKEAASEMPYPVLTPGEVPGGFQLVAVAVNRDVPSPTGAEGMNPPVADIVVLHWRKGFLSFSETLRPVSGQPWDDPFGAEGMVYPSTPVRAQLPGLDPLVGAIVVDPPARPHLWGITGDVVVTLNGDLSAGELGQVAESLRR